jgi:hypothetical protein
MSQSTAAQATNENTAEANFKDACERAQSLFAEGAESDLRTRYSVAVIAKDVTTDPAKYGEGRVEKLAEVLGHNKSSVYKWIKVAVAFDEITISDILDKKDHFGRPLSWSHVSLCASVPKQETALLQRALNESLSITQLKEIVADTRRAGKKVSAPSMHSAVKEIAKHLSSAAAIAEALESSSAFAAAGSEDAENIKAVCKTALMLSKAVPAALNALIERLEPRPGLRRAQRAGKSAARTSKKPHRQAKGSKGRSAA